MFLKWLWSIINTWSISDIYLCIGASILLLCRVFLELRHRFTEVVIIWLRNIVGKKVRVQISWKRKCNNTKPNVLKSVNPRPNIFKYSNYDLCRFTWEGNLEVSIWGHQWHWSIYKWTVYGWWFVGLFTWPVLIWCIHTCVYPSWTRSNDTREVQHRDSNHLQNSPIHLKLWWNFWEQCQCLHTW